MNHLLNYLSEKEFAYIKEEKDLYQKALALVTILFKDKKDKEGDPYVGHLIRVSEGVSNPETKVAALLHDTVEDIASITYEDLLDIGFPESVIEIVRWVTTEDKSKSYHDKITSILESGNDEAIKLKYSDMSDNADPKRLTKLDESLQKKLHKKYDEELKRLKKHIERS